MDIFVARQPVVDRDKQLFAYELLYRPTAQNSALDIESDKSATLEVLISAFMDIGIENLVGEFPALINIPGNMLVPSNLPDGVPHLVMLELLETIEVTPQIIAAVKELVDKGYKIVLDDFVYKPEWDPIIEMSSLIKLDVLALGRGKTTKALWQLKKFGVPLLAEKIETHDQFELYRTLGFDYFQGYFLAKPKMIKGNKIPSSRMYVLELLGVLYDANVTVSTIEDIVSKDARLTYKLLKIVNSSQFSLTRKIESLHEAVVMLGLSELQKWVLLLSLSPLEDEAPSPILISAMIRAKSCQLFSENPSLFNQHTKVNPSASFTMGLFSLLDAILEIDLSFILEQVPLSEDIACALNHEQGDLHTILETVIDIETGSRCRTLNKDKDQELAKLYINSIKWAEDLIQVR